MKITLDYHHPPPTTITSTNSILPHSCPTWEFQLCLKSCNIASWTTKWHNSVKGTTHHPSWKSFIYVTLKDDIGWWLVGVRKVSGGCLEGAYRRLLESVRKAWGRCLHVAKKVLESINDRSSEDRSSEDRSCQDRLSQDRSVQDSII